ncbi:uncharacterized protein LOC134879867 isoform X2 [Eleginops maclovinus]|uniref:uncharacterized protein LOC134879867 isoform X2 n=1 Tax=Eleginops maclovinus TaxID=56733 RepID=UPI003080526A
MGSWPLVVFGFVLACVRLSDARFLSMSGPTYLTVEVEMEPETEGEHPRESVQHADSLQAEQIQPAEQTLSWRFPKDPVDSVKKNPVNFSSRQPVTTNRVAVRCGESRIQVEMREHDFIYAFALVYEPKVFGRSPIVRSQSAVIGVECHYPR